MAWWNARGCSDISHSAGHNVVMCNAREWPETAAKNSTQTGPVHETNDQRRCVFRWRVAVDEHEGSLQ